MAITIREDKTSVILIQSGVGVPNHISPKSSVFFDTDAAIAYINKSNEANWVYLIDSSMMSGGTFNSDVFVTGGTYANGTATFTNNTGGTFSVSGFSTSSGGSGTDTYVTGGTYNNPTGTATFTNNTGGTFSVTGFTSGSTGIELTQSQVMARLSIGF